jgi:putative alpha-1,2-mannosidase
VVEAKRDSPGDPYIQSVTFNGKPHRKLWFNHADIVNGANIVFTLSGKSNAQFGSEEDAAPPSLGV